MATAAARPRKKPLQPPPTVKQKRTIPKVDEADEKALRKHAEYCFEQSQNAADASGPKWMAEGLKALRLARVIRDRINQLEYQRELMDHEREMAGLGRRA